MSTAVPLEKKTQIQRKFSAKSAAAALRNLYHRLPKAPNTNYPIPGPKLNPYELLVEDAEILDIGSKDAKGHYRFGSPPLDAKLVCVDIEDGDGVDLVADAQDLHMVEDNSVDGVMIVSTLQHVRHPHRAISEAFRVMKPGAVLYVNVPFMFPFHEDPYDFHRFSYDGLKVLCEKFECLESGLNRGPASCMCHLLIHFLALLFSFNSKTLYGLNVDLLKWLLFWLKYLDIFLANYGMAKIIHAGAYFVGRKPLPS